MRSNRDALARPVRIVLKLRWVASTDLRMLDSSSGCDMTLINC